MAKSAPVKVEVECPHCGFKQKEYAAAKSTMCRGCGAHFSPGAPRPTPPAIHRSRPASIPPARTESPIPSTAGAFLRQLDGLWKNKRSTEVECPECGRKQEVSGAATSTFCPGCSTHIDLQDYKITTNFSRTIRTTGDVHVTSKGDLNSSNVQCRRALLQGKLRCNLQCAEVATIDFSGKIPGRISAREVIIERRCEVTFFRRVRVTNLEIRGRMSGEVIAQGVVTIRKNASLTGNVTAKAINVEKGGLFTGELVIGRADAPSGEPLLSASAKAEPLPGTTLPLAQPVTAT